MPKNTPRKGNPTMWVILIIVVLIAVAAILYFGDFFNTNTNSNTNTVTNTNTETNTNVAVNTNTTTNQNTNTTSNTNSETNTNSGTNTNSSPNANNADNTNGSTNTNSVNNTNAPIDTSDWKTYTNVQYGYSIRYPESCTYTESTNSGGLLLTNWSGCGMDVFIDSLDNKTVEEWAQERNYKIVGTYLINQLTFTIASFTGEMAGTSSLALIPHGVYMFRIDINADNIKT